MYRRWLVGVAEHSTGVLTPVSYTACCGTGAPVFLQKPVIRQTKGGVKNFVGMPDLRQPKPALIWYCGDVRLVQPDAASGELCSILVSCLSVKICYTLLALVIK